jgi:hypothetical protein
VRSEEASVLDKVCNKHSLGRNSNPIRFACLAFLSRLSLLLNLMRRRSMKRKIKVPFLFSNFPGPPPIGTETDMSDGFSAIASWLESNNVLWVQRAAEKIVGTRIGL